MIDFKDSEITYYDFVQEISDEDVYFHYLGDFENNSWFSAPWRSDTTPSLRITYYKDKWVWTDFGEDSRPKDSINFIERYYNVDRIEAVKKGWEDIVLNSNRELNLKKSIIPHEIQSYCKLTKFTDFELEYWKKANITERDLQYFNVYSGEIRHNNFLWHKSKKNDPLFIYMFDKKIPIYKGYRPFSKNSKLKFYAKNVCNHIQGLEKLPNFGKILIITKSYKDVIVWYKLGYPAIAPHSENMFISPFDLYDLESRFEHIYVNYDNDDTGVKKSLMYCTQYNLKYFNIPKNTNCKDCFEFVCNNSYEKLEALFKNKLLRDNVKL